MKMSITGQARLGESIKTPMAMPSANHIGAGADTTFEA
jgi:hypothetical protein